MKITKKLIAQTCLPIYKELLEKGRKDNRDRFYVRLKNKKSEKGICLLYSVNNKIGDIYVFQPLKSKLSYDSEGRFDVGGKWFYKAPYRCNTKKEMVECINKRVQLLESWL